MATMKPEYRTATAGATAASGMVILTWLLSAGAGIHVPPEVSAAASGLITTALAWAVHRNGTPSDTLPVVVPVPATPPV